MSGWGLKLTKRRAYVFEFWPGSGLNLSARLQLWYAEICHGASMEIKIDSFITLFNVIRNRSYRYRTCHNDIQSNIASIIFPALPQ